MCFACLAAATVFFPEKGIKEDLCRGYEYKGCAEKQETSIEH